MEGPLLRNAPSSPVRVSFHSENWAQPSNASIEVAPSLFSTTLQQLDPRQQRDLPKTPEAPTPPPHSPDYPESMQGAQGYPFIHIPPTRKPLPPASNPTAPTLPPKDPHVQVAVPSIGDVVNMDGLGLETNNAKGPKEIAASREPDNSNLVSPPANSRFLDPHRHSRESDATSSTTQPQTSTESSVATSVSSISGVNDNSECQDDSNSGSGDSSMIDGTIPRNQSVPGFQYHHQPYPTRVASVPHDDMRTASHPDLLQNGASINRRLTPSQQLRRSSIVRPQSAYSVYSDYGPRGRSPGFFPGGSHIRTPSVSSRRSPETRPSSYADLLNVPYPQPPPAPMAFDNSRLQNAVGNNASLLSTQKTLEMYRQNVKKTNDFSIQYSFAVFLVSTAQEMGFSLEEAAMRKNSPNPARDTDSPALGGSSPHDLIREARNILQRLANGGYPFAQYYLADGYASGLFSKGKEDYSTAFPLFVLAAKHGHAESAYRAALCYEFGWGCRKDPARAVNFLRNSATKSHPGAMTRLGKACLSGDLGEKRYREGIKWLKLATESADTINNAAPYHLGCLYETGYGDDIFQDENYAAELFTQAAELGHAEANYRMGDAYEHGKLNCPRDPALSVHFYTGAAERGHAGAMMGLCAWYMVGADPILEKDEEEAYEWARRSAELGKFFTGQLCPIDVDPDG